jgi:hypothetical protein
MTSAKCQLSNLYSGKSGRGGKSQPTGILEMFTIYVNTLGTIFGEFYLKERIVIDMFVSQPKSASFSSHSEFAVRGAAEA